MTCFCVLLTTGRGPETCAELGQLMQEETEEDEMFDNVVKPASPLPIAAGT